MAGRRGGGRATIADVARTAGVSAMTVSRAINDPDSVRAETRLRVDDAIGALNYTPNPAARTLASAETVRLGLLYNNPSANYLGALLVGMLGETARAGSQLVLERCETESGAADAVRRLMTAGVDGILVPPPLCDSPGVRMLLKQAAVPFVLIASGMPGPDCASIRIDDAAAAARMTAHLIGQGHSRIGFVRGDLNQTASGEREQGYRSAMAAAGLPVDPAWVAQGWFTYRSGVEAGRKLLALPDRPTAIFASNDDMAAGVSAFAQRLHLEVPRDVAVAGFDDTQIATSTYPELTTIRQPIARMGGRAAAMLAARIRSRQNGIDAPIETLCIAFELVPRASTVPEADELTDKGQR